MYIPDPNPKAWFRVQTVHRPMVQYNMFTVPTVYQEYKYCILETEGIGRKMETWKKRILETQGIRRILET
jgi:hypothetical protein